MRRWFSEWAWIDVLTLGLGATLCISFVLYRQGHAEPKSGWVELWPDVGTSLVEVWLSIRIIDQLLKRREKRSSVFPRTRGNVLYIFGRLISVISPKFYVSDVKSLQDELGSFEKRLPKRKRLISKAELAPILAAFEREKAIGEAVKQFRETSDAILVTNSDIEAAFARLDPGSRLYSDKMAWFREVRKTYELMQDQTVHNDQEIDNLLSSVEVQSGVSHADPSVVDLLKTYVEQVRSASNLRSRIDGQIRDIGPMLEDLRSEAWSDQES